MVLAFGECGGGSIDYGPLTIDYSRPQMTSLLCYNTVIMNKTKTLTIAGYELPVLITSDEKGGYVAECTDWADCYAQAESIDEVVNEIYHVALSLIQVYQEENLTIPLTQSSATKNKSWQSDEDHPMVVSPM